MRVKRRFLIPLISCLVWWVGCSSDPQTIDLTASQVAKKGSSNEVEKEKSEAQTKKLSEGSPSKAQEISWKDLRSFDMKTRKFEDPKQNSKILGQVIKIPGYIAPFDEEGIEFMVVPYLQPCFHVPAPPPNQMIHVKLKEPSPVKFGAIWLEAKIQPAKTQKDLPEMGFEAVGPIRIRKFE